MREGDQEIVDRMVAANAARRRVVPLLADSAAPLPGEVLAFLRAGQAEDAQIEQIAKAGLEVWDMHSRKCRRNLLRLKVQPEELWKSVQNCICHWPEQKLRERQEAQA